MSAKLRRWAAVEQVPTFLHQIPAQMRFEKMVRSWLYAGLFAKQMWSFALGYDTQS